jgi:hypothetical protein
MRGRNKLEEEQTRQRSNKIVTEKIDYKSSINHPSPLLKKK